MSCCFPSKEVYVRYNGGVEKRFFLAVLYLCVFVSVCFIFLTTLLKRKLQNIVIKSDNSTTAEITTYPRITATTPSPRPVVWNTYTDKNTGYRIDYPSTRAVNENNTNGYDHIDFFSGCFQITSGTVQQISKLAEIIPIPWSKLEELSSLPEGEKKSFIAEKWDLGQGNEFNLTETYLKIRSRKIGGVPWNSFSVTNNYENHGYLKQYFVQQKDNLYFISSLSDGPCWIDEPERMLNTFEFTN